MCHGKSEQIFNAIRVLLEYVIYLSAKIIYVQQIESALGRIDLKTVLQVPIICIYAYVIQLTSNGEQYRKARGEKKSQEWAVAHPCLPRRPPLLGLLLIVQHISKFVHFSDINTWETLQRMLVLFKMTAKTIQFIVSQVHYIFEHR